MTFSTDNLHVVVFALLMTKWVLEYNFFLFDIPGAVLAIDGVEIFQKHRVIFPP